MCVCFSLFVLLFSYGVPLVVDAQDAVKSASSGAVEKTKEMARRAEAAAAKAAARAAEATKDAANAVGDNAKRCVCCTRA